MRRSFVLIGMAIVMVAMIVPAGNVSGAEFPSVDEIFDSDNINYPDIGFDDIFGYAQDLLRDPSAFDSVLSLTGFVDFLQDTFTATSSGDINSIAAIAMVVCILVIILSLVSAALGRRSGNKARKSTEED